MRSIGRVISDEFHGRSRWRRSFRPNRATVSPFGSTATVRRDSGRCSMVSRNRLDAAVHRTSEAGANAAIAGVPLVRAPRRVTRAW